MSQSSELDKLAPALVSLQADLRPVEKSADNPFFKSKYAPLPEVREALQPLLAKHKLALTDFPAFIEGKNGLRFYLIHESGQYISGEWQLNPVKDDPQGEGSDITYKRRYGDMAITGQVAEEDDDGNAASSSSTQKAKATTRYEGSGNSSGPKASPNKEPSEAQIALIQRLGRDKGYGDDWFAAVLMKIKTSADASAVIEKLKATGDE